MLLQITELIVCFFLALFLVTGIVSLTLLTFYCKYQRHCRSLIILTADDTDTEFRIRACLRADRLLGRTLPPILVDTGICGERKEIVRRAALRYDLPVIVCQQSDNRNRNPKNI